MATYTRTYIYQRKYDSARVNTDLEIPFDRGDGYKLTYYSGDTAHEVKRLLSIVATVYIETDSAVTLSWRGTLVYGGNTYQITATNTERTGAGTWGTVLAEWDVMLFTAEDFAELESIISRPLNGHGTNFKERPMYLTITYESGEYLPEITNFTVQRCLANGTPDAEGQYALAQFTARIAKPGADDGAAYSILLTDGQGNDVISASGFSAVSGYVSAAGVTTVAPRNVQYAGTVETPFTLTIIYHDEIVSATQMLFPSSTNVSLSTCSTGGVAFGRYSRSTENNPLFECAYPATFEKLVTFEGGVSGISAMQHGFIVPTGEKVASNHHDAYTVTFDEEFDDVPWVIAGFQSNDTGHQSGSCNVAVDAVTTTGFTIHVYNYGGTQFDVQRINWLAIEN